MNADKPMQFLKVSSNLNFYSREVRSVGLHALQKTSSENIEQNKFS